ncbi:hypothetical protein HDU97_004144 [Phlyctochytrium planicorne]|nr:hypothetical protein HDU97_004144 [Phlyctochytrium planicorne]
MAVTISWNRKKFEVPIIDEQGSPAFNKTTLGALVEKCSKLTGVPVDRIKLLIAGGEKDGNNPSSGAGTTNGGGAERPGGKRKWEFFKNVGRSIDNALDDFVNWISGEDELNGERGSFGRTSNLAIKQNTSNPNISRSHSSRPHSQDPSNHHHPYAHPSPSSSNPNMQRSNTNSSAAPPQPPRPLPKEPQYKLAPEDAFLQKLEDVMSPLRSTIVPLIESYSALATSVIGGTAEGVTEKQLKFEHSRISELLLQSLLKLDGAVVPGENDDLRAKRKLCVKEVNALLDRTDGIKERVMDALKSRPAL